MFRKIIFGSRPDERFEELPTKCFLTCFRPILIALALGIDYV